MHLPGSDRLLQAGCVYRGQNATDKDKNATDKDVSALDKVKIFPVRSQFARLGLNPRGKDDVSLIKDKNAIGKGEICALRIKLEI